MTSNSGLPPTNRDRDDAASSSNAGSDRASSKPRRHVGSTADQVSSSPKIRQAPLATPDPASIMPEPLSKAKERAERPPRRSPSRGRDSISGSDGTISIQVRQETLVLFGLVVCSSLLGAFLFGHQVGKNRRLPKAGGAAPAMIDSQRNPLTRTRKPARRSNPSPAKTVAAKKLPEHWTLCAISYTITTRAKAEDMIQILSAAIPNHKVFPKQSNKTLMVCVGYFNSSSDPGLKALRGALRKMRYRGETPFKDCYPVKL